MGRLRELDSIRGVAALVVVFHHVLSSFYRYAEAGPFGGVDTLRTRGFGHAVLWLAATPLRLAVAGPAAVSVFFLLSGFVLTLPFIERRESPYPQYLVKRLCRLYLPFAAAVLLAAALCAALPSGPVAELTSWFNGKWGAPVTVRLILGHLAMPGLSQYLVLDDPAWSLIHEMRICLVFPVLAVLTLRHPRWMLAAGVATYGVLTLVKREWLAPMHELTLRDLLGSGATTLQYTLFFIAGVVLAARLTVLHAALSDLPKVVRRLLWLAAALLLSIPDYDNSFTLFFFSSLLGAALLLLLCLDSPAAQRVLTLKPLHWLGRVSYSLYLVHLVVIVALVRALHLQVAAPLLLLAAVPLSLLVAEVFYQLVERPSQSLGRRLAARVERSMDGFGGRGGRSLRTG